MWRPSNARTNWHGRPIPGDRIPLVPPPPSAILPLRLGLAPRLLSLGYMETAVLALFAATVSDRHFWNMKIKIAILAAATFAAMC